MRALQRFRPLAARLALLFAVIGPGIITANVDNDAGGITTYSLAGAHYGYATLWIMPLLAVVLILVQEMSARLGVVTGKGLADLIRESLGVRITEFEESGVHSTRLSKRWLVLRPEACSRWP